MPRIRHILHASDFSRASGPAFAMAVEMARTNRATLTVLHVLTPPMPLVADGYVPPDTYQRLEAAARASGQKQLDRLVARARKAGVRARSLLVLGVPHEQIARAAKSRRANLAVIGTHGRTGLPRLFLGSVAARVIAIAPCPVLTVRGR